jgi:hypothetical protein
MFELYHSVVETVVWETIANQQVPRTAVHAIVSPHVNVSTVWATESGKTHHTNGQSNMQELDPLDVVLASTQRVCVGSRIDTLHASSLLTVREANIVQQRKITYNSHNLVDQQTTEWVVLVELAIQDHQTGYIFIVGLILL